MIGNKIKTKRKQQGLTISEFSKKIGVSNSYISQLEHNNTDPSVSVLQKIANVLDTPIAYFFETEYEEPIVIQNNKTQFIQKESYQYKYISPKDTDMTIKQYVLETNAMIQETCSQACLHVMKGALQVTINQGSYILHEDDSLLLTSHYAIKNIDLKSSIFILCEVHI